MKYFLIGLIGFVMSCKKITPHQVKVIKESEISDTIIIANREQISFIADLIEDKKKEPIKFMIIYELQLIFSDTTITYFGNKKYLKDKNSTYVLPNDSRLKKFLSIMDKS
jgi:hypothetical protein